MKKKLFSPLPGMVVLGGLILLATQSTAQQAAPPNGQPAMSQPTTKVAILNLSYVVKSYQAYTDFTTTLKKDIEVYEIKMKGKKASYDVAVAEATKDTNPANREGHEKKLKGIQREMEDISNEGKTFAGKKSDEQMVVLYKEIQETAVRYANARGYEMVLHFNDAPAGTSEYYSPPNIARKMQAGALMPLYVHPALDISPLVVQTLNQGYEIKKKQAGTPPTGGQPR